MNHSPLETELEELETRLERLRALYDQYFLGIEKLEPQIPRKDVERRIHALRKQQIRNTGLRFKMNMLVQRFNTLQQLWGRVLREIENGTYRRDVVRAAALFGANAPSGPLRHRRGRRIATAAMSQTSSDAARSEEVPQALAAELSPHQEPLEPSSQVRPTSVVDLDFEDSTLPNLRVATSMIPHAAILETPVGAMEVRVSQAAHSSLPPLPSSLPGIGFAPPSFRGSSPPPIPQRSGAPPLPSRASLGPPPIPVRSLENSHGAFGSTLPAGQAAGFSSSVPPPQREIAVPASPSAQTAATPRAAVLSPPPERWSMPVAAPPPRTSATETAPGPDLSEPRLRQLYERYVEARRSTNEAVAGLTYERLASTLRSEAAKLQSTYKTKQIDYEVVTKDGKTVLKPVIR